MFGRSREVAFSYGRRRTRRRLPRWLVLWMAGVLLGAAAVILVQERHLPPRLSAAESAALRGQFEEVDAERLRLRLDLAGTQNRLEDALLHRQAGAEALAASLASTARSRDELTAVVNALPPDPRGGVVAVRTGHFTVKGDGLEYSLVLTREHAVGKPVPGTLQLRVAGESGRGVQGVVTPKAIPVLLGSHAVFRGSLPLHAGFKPRQTTIQVFDQPAGRPLGMRVVAIQ